MRNAFFRFSTLAAVAAGVFAGIVAPAPPLAAAPATPAFRLTYEKPPQNVLDVLHAPSPAVPVLSPARDKAILVTWVQYPAITRVAEPFLRLAGNRVEPRNRSNHSTPGGYGIAPGATDYVLLKIPDASEIHVVLPPGACAGRPVWSADGKRFAFENTGTDAVELWVGDGETGEVHRVGELRLNQMLGSTLQWMADQRTLLVKLVPPNQGAAPSEEVVSVGPSIQETSGEKGQSSTYEARDVLLNQHDEDLFDYYSASQLALVDTTTGAVIPIGPVAAYADLDAAPDGEHILVEAIQRPYSHLVTSERFPRDVSVWDRAGKTVYRVAQIPLADRVPVHGVPTGPREFGWRANLPATLVWAEALDGGDWNVKAPERDKVMMQAVPFSSPPREVVRMEQRFAGFMWGEQANFALLTDIDENRHWTRTYVADVDEPTVRLHLLWDLSTDEHYKNPGTPVFKPLANGFTVVRQEGDSIYLSGLGSSPDGDRPFLDRLDIRTGKSERLFRCSKEALESFVGFSGGTSTKLLTWHQSPTEPPNLFRLTSPTAVTNAPAGEAAFAWTAQPLTHIPDPTPAVRAIRKHLVKYKRQDGLDLSFTIYLPPDYKEGTRVPTILYAYPLDYAGAAEAGQVTGSQQNFTRLANYRFLLLAGYAIIDAAAFPVIGDPKKAYDTYLEQLVADAKAAVDKAVEIGVADPDRIGVTGHSHGALMTVNLLAHSDLFRAGVATSGSYNKTLTAFGFQNERRSVWEAPEVYFKVSPFFSADKLKLPLLIIHGEDDANPGTTPLQAEKLYEAIRGNGGIARLVMLPHEPHWYSAMESQEQQLYEMIRWFDRYVKNAPARPPTQ